MFNGSRPFAELAYSQGWDNADYQFSLAAGYPPRVVSEVLGAQPSRLHLDVCTSVADELAEPAAFAIVIYALARHGPLRQGPAQRQSSEVRAQVVAEDRGFEPRRVLPPNRISSAAP